MVNLPSFKSVSMKVWCITSIHPQRGIFIFRVLKQCNVVTILVTLISIHNLYIRHSSIWKETRCRSLSRISRTTFSVPKTANDISAL